MNVKFIQLTAEKFKSAATYTDGKYQGLFVHLTENVTVDDIEWHEGLYYGGKDGWEMLSNDFSTLNGTAAVASIDKDGNVTLKTTVEENEGIITSGATEINLATVATTGAAEDIKFAQYPSDANDTDSDSTNNSLIANGANLQDVMESVVDTINKTTAGAVVALFDKDGNALDADAAEVKADGTTYTLKQGNAVVAKFNIVKDSFVKSGSVVYGTLNNGVFTEDTAAKDGSNAYIKLQLASRTNDTDAADGDVIYIPASSLIEYASVDKDGLYLTESEDHVISVTTKVKDAITKVEGLTVNGQAVAADGKVTIDATDIMYGGESDGTASDDMTVEDALDKLAATAYTGVANEKEDQYVKVSEIDAENKQTLSVTIGSFTVPATADTPEEVQVPGLATVEAVEKVITDNEKVTSTALNNLDERVRALEAIDPIDTTVAGDAGETTGVTVTVTDTPTDNNNHDYKVTAEMVWLTELPA